ncbi:hypothetical protein KC363_g5159 [Hortaea werneckii]|uniref:Uncharacterized protein n=1 Tax=Hortaea werneckii TaxID=91943 RepID=A0A3M7F1Y3_HORWE|nr:hypothetical protein KC361_g9057 [Hortaea werneckii]KAI6882983.1 hypothetical protein KC325_g5389 [Hortaea werneckii]KAI6985605.1 hypothetical protein KC359_g9088 [Hortaea werneckii]KAI7140104.1 hypothetical protein KC344_g8940 [Hortaea werneckii]KAI7172796.1 hypothetical protein KC360_g5270 [Hortaea werneckii]
MDRRPRATPRAPSSRPLPVPSPNPGGATTAVATSSSSAGRPSTTTTTTTTGSGTGNRPPRSSESYHAFAQREEAARVLQSYERLSWYSYARCESLAQTRLHFRNLVAGFGPDDEAAHRGYTEDLTPLPSSKREEVAGVKASRKGKERASLLGVDGGGGGDAGGSPARGGEGIATPSSAGKKKKRRSEG